MALLCCCDLYYRQRIYTVVSVSATPYGHNIAAAGAGGGSVDVSDIEVHGITATIVGCFAGVRFNNDGSISQITGGTGGTFTALGDDDTGYHDNSDSSTGGEVDHTSEWWTENPEATIGEDYQFQVQTIVSGSLDGFNDFGTGVWDDIDLAPKIATTRTGGKGGQGAGTDRAVVTCRIRLKASPFTVLATFDVECISHRGGT